MTTKPRTRSPIDERIATLIQRMATRVANADDKTLRDWSRGGADHKLVEVYARRELKRRRGGK